MSRSLVFSFVRCIIVSIVGSQAIEQRCVPVGNTAYFVSKNQLNFDSAISYCRNINAKLVTLDTKNKADAVYNILKQRDGENASSRFYWINARDTLSFANILQTCGERHFIWLVTEKCLSTTYADWCPDEPNRKYEKCVDIEAPGDSYCWADVDCNAEKYFVCEAE